MENNRYIEYSLGLEELALVFGLINRKDLGKQIIEATYDDLTSQQVEERLTAASHSLMARGLTFLSDTGTLQMDPELEKAVFPLTTFDYLLQLSLVINGGQAFVTVHIQKNKLFTAHLVKAGVVHILTHGAVKDLLSYVLDVFDVIGLEKPDKVPTIKHPISLGVLGEIQKIDKDTDGINRILSRNGWKESDAGALSQDLLNQKMRGTLVRINSNQTSQLEKVQSMQNATLLLLKGDQHSWLFEFPDTKDTNEGFGRIVDRKLFEEIAKSFII